jgi:hypothetical protein
VPKGKAFVEKSSRTLLERILTDGVGRWSAGALKLKRLAGEGGVSTDVGPSGSGLFSLHDEADATTSFSCPCCAVPSLGPGAEVSTAWVRFSSVTTGFVIVEVVSRPGDGLEAGTRVMCSCILGVSGSSPSSSPSLSGIALMVLNNLGFSALSLVSEIVGDISSTVEYQ